MVTIFELLFHKNVEMYSKKQKSNGITSKMYITYTFLRINMHTNSNVEAVRWDDIKLD